MATKTRKKKPSQEDIVGKDCWWINQDGEGQKTIVYTTKTTKLKTKDSGIKEMATYQGLGGKLLAMQYSVETGSKAEEKLFSELGLTDKDKVKEKRSRKKV